MGQFRDVSIKNVIEELNQSYFLPDIQREFVWLRKANEKKIEQLFDSILRGYPIGSFLFWKLKKNDIETNKDAKEDSDKLNFQLYKFIENYDCFLQTLFVLICPSIMAIVASGFSLLLPRSFLICFHRST